MEVVEVQGVPKKCPIAIFRLNMFQRCDYTFSDVFRNQNFEPIPSKHSNFIHPESKLPQKRKKMHAQTRFLSQLLEVKLELCRLFIMEVNITVAHCAIYVLVIYSVK